MREVYLTFVERHPYGCEPNGITFFVGLSPISLSDDNIKILLEHVFRTENNPRQILEKLEKIVFDSIREKPSVHDTLQSRPEDEAPEYANQPRQSGYLAEGSWSNSEEEEKRAKENMAIRNKKLLEIYNSFIKSVSAKSLR